jgi:uncharacterized protein (DUF58 family)
MFSGVRHWIAYAGIGYDILLASLVLVDVFVTPLPKTLWAVEREVDDRLSLAVQNRISVVVRLIGDVRAPFVLAPRIVTVRDEPPLNLELTGSDTGSVCLSTKIREGSQVYHLRPDAKGDYEFGDISLAYDGVLGLIRRSAVFPAAKKVKVYPNLKDTEKYELLVKRGRLAQMGLRAAKLRGGGSEFESMREYVPGDEYRKIDWSATARQGKLITRQYEVERSQNILLVLDTGRTMLAPVNNITKMDIVINTALMLAYVGVSMGDKVGLLVFDDQVRAFMPPARGRSQVVKIIEELYNTEAEMVESDYRKAVSDILARWRRRSLVVLFTDLVDPDSSVEILRAIPQLNKLHRTVCVSVSDPQIVEGSRLAPATSTDVYRKSVSTTVLYERRQAINQLKRSGIWCIDSSPQDLSADLINHYLEVKARSGV